MAQTAWAGIMANDLTTRPTWAQSSPSPGMAVVDHPRYPLSDVRQWEMSALMVAPTAIEMAKELTHLGVKADVMIQPNDGGANIVALQNYMRTYFPPTEVVYFAIELLASTHSFFRAKQMGDEEFRRYLFSTLMTRKNKRVHALPACIQEVLAASLSFAVHRARVRLHFGSDMLRDCRSHSFSRHPWSVA